MYVRVEEGSVIQFPYRVADLKRDNPNVGFPKNLSDEMLAEYGVYPVQPTERPAVNPLQTTRVSPLPALNEETGAWELVWVVKDLPADEVRELVNEERDRRIDAGFTFGGVFYQSAPSDRENIAGASTSALAAIMNGAVEGDYRWHGGEVDFAWIAADNTTIQMDAQTMFAFGQAAMAHKQVHIFAARLIKDADPVPPNYTDDGYWP
jgi:hypothetical protein